MSSIQNVFKTIGFINQSTADIHKHHQLEVQYINNRDGSVRWVWPLGLKRPLFLKFYHIQGCKSGAFSWLLKLVFALNIQKWVFKRAIVSINTPHHFNLNFSNNNWALFTGTVGPNQKYIHYTEDETEKGIFTKIAITPQAISLIKKERTVLQKLASSDIKNFTFPKLLHQDECSLSVLNKKSYYYRTHTFSPEHAKALFSLRNIEQRNISFETLDNMLHLHERLTQLQQTRKKVPSGILKKLSHLLHLFHKSYLNVNLAHGDFTPWNMYADEAGKLYIYDWELVNGNYPEGFDFFHFIIQKGILSEHKNWSQIKSEIKSYLPFFIKKSETNYYLSLYLLINVLYYLEIYEKQTHWHLQIHWLLDVWNTALSDVLGNSMNHRKLVILDLFDYLHDIQYAGLKLPLTQPEKLSLFSDIDLLLSKNDTSMLLKHFKNHPLTAKISVRSGIAMTKIIVLTRDHTVFSLDAIHQLKRKHLEYMNVRNMIRHARTDNDGIRHVSARDTDLFIGLFYGLNNAVIPDKYKKYSTTIRTSQVLLDKALNHQISSGKPHPKQLRDIIKSRPENRGISGLKNRLAYFLDTIYNVFSNRGLIITFSGVDGAGKSTIIEKTKYELEKKFRKNVVIIRHRPSLLPILSAWIKGKAAAEKAAAEQLPRQGKNKSFIGSLLRFSYYYIDYFFGQFYIYLKYVLRGQVVLYDRYYFDFINDSLRSNIVLPQWVFKMGYFLILKPHLNFFLYADPKIILSRKKELDENTISKLTHDYLSLFYQLGNQCPHQYHAIENITLDKTVAFISNQIQAKLI